MTVEPKKPNWKGKSSSKTWALGFHVNFPGRTSYSPATTVNKSTNQLNLLRQRHVPETCHIDGRGAIEKPLDWASFWCKKNVSFWEISRGLPWELTYLYIIFLHYHLRKNKFEDHFTFYNQRRDMSVPWRFYLFFWGGGVGANYSSSISHLSWMFLFPRPKHGHVEESELECGFERKALAYTFFKQIIVV